MGGWQGSRCMVGVAIQSQPGSGAKLRGEHLLTPRGITPHCMGLLDRHHDASVWHLRACHSISVRTPWCRCADITSASWSSGLYALCCQSLFLSSRPWSSLISRSSCLPHLHLATPSLSLLNTSTTALTVNLTTLFHPPTHPLCYPCARAHPVVVSPSQDRWVVGG